MKRKDERDEALGSLLRTAAQASAEAAERIRELDLTLPDFERHRIGALPISPAHPSRKTATRFPARIAGGVALAACLAGALMLPYVARLQAQRELLLESVGHLSRSLIRESSSFLAELPAASELEAAASDWAGSLFRTDIDL